MKDVNDGDIKQTVFSVVSDALNAFESQSAVKIEDRCEIKGTEHWLNHKGHWVAKERIKTIDVLRDEVTKDLWLRAKRVHDFEVQSKEYMFDTLFDFFDISAMEHETEFRNPKGNTGVPSFCGNFKIQLSKANYLEFDERATLAKQLVDEFLLSATADDSEIGKELLISHFELDKKGKFSTHKLLSLFQHDFDHPKWREAISVLRLAYKIGASKDHLKFYKRNEHGQYVQMSLEFGKL